MLGKQREDENVERSSRESTTNQTIASQETAEERARKERSRRRKGIKSLTGTLNHLLTIDGFSLPPETAAIPVPVVGDNVQFGQVPRYQLAETPGNEISQITQNASQASMDVGSRMNLLNAPGVSARAGTLNDIISASLLKERPKKRLRHLTMIPQHAPSQILGQYGRTEITKETIERTFSPKWFSDTLITASIEDFVRRSPEITENTCFVHTTVFKTLSAGGTMEFLKPLDYHQLQANCQLALSTLKRLDIFSKHLFFMPIQFEDHWMVVVVINPMNLLVDREEDYTDEKCDMMFLDPMGNLLQKRNERVYKIVSVFLSLHLQTLQQQSKPLYTNMIFLPEYLFLVHPKNLPLQTNMYDCGPAIVHYIEALLDSFTGLLKQRDPENIDWNDLVPRSSIETSRHRVRARILNSSSGTNRTKLNDIVEYASRTNVASLDVRRSRSVERRSRCEIARKLQKRRFSVGNGCMYMEHNRSNWLTNPSVSASHPATEVARKLEPQVYYSIYH